MPPKKPPPKSPRKSRRDKKEADKKKLVVDPKSIQSATSTAPFEEDEHRYHRLLDVGWKDWKGKGLETQYFYEWKGDYPNSWHPARELPMDNTENVKMVDDLLRRIFDKNAAHKFHAGVEKFFDQKNIKWREIRDAARAKWTEQQGVASKRQPRKNRKKVDTSSMSEEDKKRLEMRQRLARENKKYEERSRERGIDPWDWTNDPPRPPQPFRHGDRRSAVTKERLKDIREGRKPRGVTDRDYVFYGLRGPPKSRFYGYTQEEDDEWEERQRREREEMSHHSRAPSANNSAYSPRVHPRNRSAPAPRTRSAPARQQSPVRRTRAVPIQCSRQPNSTAAPGSTRQVCPKKKSTQQKAPQSGNSQDDSSHFDPSLRKADDKQPRCKKNEEKKKKK